MKLQVLTPEQWKVHAEAAHMVAFGKHKPASWDRLDFVMVTENDDGVPVCYVTCQERDAESLYWQYGGSFPGSKGTILTWASLMVFIGYTRERYKRLSMLIENSNIPMLRLAMKAGLLIVGMRNFKDTILLEHGIEFQEAA